MRHWTSPTSGWVREVSSTNSAHPSLVLRAVKTPERGGYLPIRGQILHGKRDAGAEDKVRAKTDYTKFST
jgi:hypothetical protein